MKAHTFKSTKGSTFTIELPENYKRRKLPFYNWWIAALESGKYRQCTGTLCSVSNKKLTYCCLGVLSKIQGRLKKFSLGYEDYDEHDTTLHENNPSYDALGCDGSFPLGVSVTHNKTKEVAYDLMNCNDELRLSFKDIAKIIRMVYTT